MKYFSYESFGDFAQILYIYLFSPYLETDFLSTPIFYKIPYYSWRKGFESELLLSLSNLTRGAGNCFFFTN